MEIANQVVRRRWRRSSCWFYFVVKTWTSDDHWKPWKEKVSKKCNLITFYAHIMTQNYHSNLKKELFNIFWNEKDRNKEFVFRFWLRKIMILSQDFVFNFLYFGFRCIMKWSVFSDTLLVREILVIEPYQLILKSNERGQA